MVRPAMRRSTSVIAMLILSACTGVQSPLAPAGDQASALHMLLIVMTVVCGLVYLLVMGGLVWAVMRARSRRRKDEGRAEKRVDRALHVAAGIIVVGLTILITVSFFADRALFATRGKDAMAVRVTGHQWWWRIEYRDPASGRWIETANELHLPLGRTTRVELASGDVIHSFWVPNVSGKIDMIPGRRNLLDLTPRRTGWFRGACTEFCGAQHAHMAFDVKVEAPADFDLWLKTQAAPAASGAPATGRGAQLFATKCAACHRIRGTSATGRAGPDLTHVAARRSIAAGTLPMTRGALQGWIAQPQALKPGTSMPAVPLLPADADALAAYLARLR